MYYADPRITHLPNHIWLQRREFFWRSKFNHTDVAGLPSIDVLASYTLKPILLEVTGGSKFADATLLKSAVT